MSLRIRRGTEAQRTGVILETGEIAWTTDYRQLWVGDGLQPGGYPVVGANVAGYGLSYNNTSHKLEVAGLTTDDVVQGVNNKYFSAELAQDAAAALFNNGSHTGITFQYDDTQAAINAVVTLDTSTSDNIRELAQDSVWTMLRDGSHSNISFTYNDNGTSTGTINATVTLDGVGIASVQADTSPLLGGNLGLNSRNIVGSGDINITGDVIVTGKLDNGVISIDNGVITSTSDTFTFGTNTAQSTITVLTNNKFTPSAVLTGLTDGPQAGTSLEFKASRGTISAPAAVQPADGTGLITSFAYDASGYQLTTLIGSFIDPNGSVGVGTTTGMIALVTFSDTTPTNAKGVYINRNGWVTIGRTLVDDATAELDVNGTVKSSLFKAGQQDTGVDFNNGYSFSGSEGGHDTGMFSSGDGIIKLISNTNTVITVNTNKTISLPVLTSAPAGPTNGSFAVADRVTWDPAGKGSGGSYPVYYDGTSWNALF